ncbi:GntR family transcriptional regulator [Streptacidiphilus sp. N1-10]|uniref:GntR family transcriptional regulator n=1 Tax=Streptacidiphilus jeojiensis TaxID=3229225 RepID=A0ABV6XK67_9ACTN
MSEVLSKHQRIADLLTQEIRAGRLRQGSQLPGEHALTKRFAVSRTTVRQALRKLSDEGLIATRAGIGSVVTFDGTPLDDREGWTAAFAYAGTPLAATVLRLESVLDAELAQRLGLAEETGFLALDRVRSLAVESGDVPVSLELSRSLLVPELAEVPRTGLLDGSLTRTLAAAGLIQRRGRQVASVAPLPPSEATALARPAGEAFLKVERTSWDQDDGFVEHVTSWLSPEHFRLELTFGGPAG